MAAWARSVEAGSGYGVDENHGFGEWAATTTVATVVNDRRLFEVVDVIVAPQSVVGYGRQLWKQQQIVDAFCHL